MNITFLGLGVMGYPMAGHLQKAGHDVCVYNRTTAKAIRWVEQYQGRYAETPSLAVKNAEMVMICVGNDDDVREMTTGKQGIFSSLSPDTIVIDHTTTSSDLAKELSTAAKNVNIHFLDAPVSGGQAGAENAQLAIMVGGDSAIFSRVQPVLDIYAKSMTLMGGPGAGQATKMVNQLLIAGVLQGMSEGFALAEKEGLSLPDVISAISEGAAGSWQLSNRGYNIHNNKFDYGFAIDWMCKDLNFCLNAAKHHDLTLPNAQQVYETYQRLQQLGCGRLDTSALVKQYEDE